MSTSLVDRPNRAPKRLSLLHTTSTSTSSTSTVISSPFSPTSGPRPLQLLDPTPSPGPSTAPLPIHSPIASPSPTSSTGSRPNRLLQSRRQSSISYVSHSNCRESERAGGSRNHQRSPSLLVRSNSHNVADSLRAARHGVHINGLGNGVKLERKSLDSSSSDAPVPMSPADRPPLTLVEKHADLLQFIAQKEAKCLDLRSQLATHEAELLAMKRKWERIVSRGLDGPSSSLSSSPLSSSSEFTTANLNPSSKQAQAAVIGGIKEVGRFIVGLSELGNAALPTPLPISTTTQKSSKGAGHVHRQSTSSTSTYATTNSSSTGRETTRLSQSSMSSAGTGDDERDFVGRKNAGGCVDLDSPNGRLSFDELPLPSRRSRDGALDAGSDGTSDQSEEGEADNTVTVKLDNIGATATFSPNPAAPTSSSTDFTRSPMKKLSKQGHGHGRGQRRESLRADLSAALMSRAGEEERKLGSPSSSSSDAGTTTASNTPDTSPSNTSNASSKSTTSYHTPTPRPRPARQSSSSSTSLLSSPTPTPTSSDTTSPTSATMPPFSSWVVGTATKKWEELQKSQKRASVLLSDVSTSLFAALSPPPPPTPSTTTSSSSTRVISGEPRRSFDHADWLESGVGSVGNAGVGGFGGGHAHSLIDADDDGIGEGDMSLLGDMIALSPDPYSSASRPSMRTDSPSPTRQQNGKAIREEDEEEWNW